MKGVLHLIEDDLGETGEDFLWRALAEIVAALEARLEAEVRMDEIDRSPGQP